MVSLGCAPGEGGSGAADGGTEGDGATASCEDVLCVGTTHCEAGECVCNEGLVREGLDCVDAPLPEMGDRTEHEVCSRWAEDHVNLPSEWMPLDPEDPCDPGEVHPDAIRNAVLRTNLYRWLVGLEPVGYARDLFDAVQECSIIQRAQGGLDHHPDPTTACYTQLGGDTAGQSNLSAGSGMAGSVDAYVGDGGVDSLGHRRWVLSPNLSEVAFGLKEGFSCMHVFRSGPAEPVEFVAWPPAGNVPLTAARGRWSLAFVGGRNVTDRTEIEVAVDGGAPEAVNWAVIPGGFGSANPTLGWDMPASVYRHGATVEVTARNLNDGDLSYTLRFTDCGG